MISCNKKRKGEEEASLRSLKATDIRKHVKFITLALVAWHFALEFQHNQVGELGL